MFTINIRRRSRIWSYRRVSCFTKLDLVFSKSFEQNGAWSNVWSCFDQPFFLGIDHYV